MSGHLRNVDDGGTELEAEVEGVVVEVADRVTGENQFGPLLTLVLLQQPDTVKGVPANHPYLVVFHPEASGQRHFERVAVQFFHLVFIIIIIWLFDFILRLTAINMNQVEGGSSRIDFSKFKQKENGNFSRRFD